MSFNYMNVETKRKYKNIYIFFISNFFTRPANNFFLHKYRNERKIQQNLKKNSDLKKLTSPANKFLISCFLSLKVI